MVDFDNNRQIFKIHFLCREIWVLGTCNPGIENFLKVLKKRFLASESISELSMTHGRVYKFCE